MESFTTQALGWMRLHLAEMRMLDSRDEDDKRGSEGLTEKARPIAHEKMLTGQ